MRKLRTLRLICWNLPEIVTVGAILVLIFASDCHNLVWRQVAEIKPEPSPSGLLLKQEK